MRGSGRGRGPGRERTPSAAHGLCEATPTPTPHFLPTSPRNAAARFLAFVGLEGDPPAPCRRERTGQRVANGSLDRGSQASRRLAMDPPPRRESGRGWDRATSGTARGVTAPGHLRKARSGEQETVLTPKTRAARSLDETAELARAGGAGSLPERHRREAEDPEAGRRPPAAPTPTKRSRQAASGRHCTSRTM